VTFGELTKWAEIRHWGARRRRELAGWLSGIPVLPGDEPVAAHLGRPSAVAIGRPRAVNDMWIAAAGPNRFRRESTWLVEAPRRARR